MSKLNNHKANSGELKLRCGIYRGQKGKGGVGMESRDWLEISMENMGYVHIW